MVERKVWLIGAGDFGFDIASKFARVPGDGNVFMGFIDSRDDAKKQTKSNCERIGLPAMFENPESIDFSDPKNRFIFGIGDAKFKKQFAEKYNLITDNYHRFEDSPNISNNSEIGLGIYWGCRIASSVKIGQAVFIDANSVIGHGACIGNFCHIAVGVIVGGNSSIGEACLIHSGAIIGNNVFIGEGCEIGVGAVVVRNLPAGTKVIAPKSPVI